VSTWDDVFGTSTEARRHYSRSAAQVKSNPQQSAEKNFQLAIRTLFVTE
jgi:hypothetical protein